MATVVDKPLLEKALKTHETPLVHLLTEPSSWLLLRILGIVPTRIAMRSRILSLPENLLISGLVVVFSSLINSNCQKLLYLRRLIRP